MFYFHDAFGLRAFSVVASALMAGLRRHIGNRDKSTSNPRVRLKSSARSERYPAFTGLTPSRVRSKLHWADSPFPCNLSLLHWLLSRPRRGAMPPRLKSSSLWSFYISICLAQGNDHLLLFDQFHPRRVSGSVTSA